MCVLHTARISNVKIVLCGERMKDGKFNHVSLIVLCGERMKDGKFNRTAS